MIIDGDLATELDSGTAYLEHHRMLDAHPFNFVFIIIVFKFMNLFGFNSKYFEINIPCNLF